MREVSDVCLQYGGACYLWESPVLCAFRDECLASNGGGAHEIMRTAGDG